MGRKVARAAGRECDGREGREHGMGSNGGERRRSGRGQNGWARETVNRIEQKREAQWKGNGGRRRKEVEGKGREWGGTVWREKKGNALE